MKTINTQKTKLSSRQWFYRFALLLFNSLLVVACSGGSNSNVNEQTTPTVTAPPPPPPTAPAPATNVAVPDNRFLDSYSILIFGNSHTAGIGDLIGLILQAEYPDINIHIDSFGGGFLDNPSTNPQRLQRLQSREWSHVILQGQKYSQSGTVDYSTLATENWIKQAKNQTATPVLFPEHPQRHNPDEGQRVHNLHQSISAKQSACIAPVGLAWDRVIALRPDLSLHLQDGNHASASGKVITAMVFYEVITGYPANLLPYIDELGVSPELQQFFGQIVSETISANTPCRFESDTL